MNIRLFGIAAPRLYSVLFAVGCAVALSLSGCDKPSGEPSPDDGQVPRVQPENEDVLPEKPMQPSVEEKDDRRGDTNWFGGEVYDGEPALETTAALVEAGGGADDFSFAKALVAMLGEGPVQQEVDKLTEQYGEEQVKQFIDGMDFAVNDALERAEERGIELPDPPEDLHGVELAKTLVKAGTASDGTFWSGYLFDKTLSHELHNLVMADIDAKIGREADEITHKILNQAMYDIAQALDMKDVKLATLH